MAEDKFEQAVIDKLKSEGWEYLTDYSGVTVDQRKLDLLKEQKKGFLQKMFV